jgi:hypothetical protein
MSMRESGVYLFVSVDMVNSTEFKSREPNWPFVLHHFYENVVTEIKRVCPKFNVWKYIGDEVTFWRYTDAQDNLADLIRGTSDALQIVCARLDSLEQENTLRIKTRHLTGAKATMWVASAHLVRTADLEHDLTDNSAEENRIIEEEHEITLPEQEQATIIKSYDFIGPDIDIGFRVAHFAHRGILALSAGLACLVLHQATAAEEIDNNIKIVDYQSMKGVWGGRRYPIIWYFKDWPAPGGTFYYDDEFENPVVYNITHRHEHIYDIGRIEKILTEANRWSAIERACKLLKLDPGRKRPPPAI